MPDEVTLRIIGQVLNYGLLGGVTIVVSFLYWRSQQKIDQLQATILELTGTAMTTIANNSAALNNNAAANDRAAESFRDLADLVREIATRRSR